jgi:hypothetical protein
LHKSKTKIGSAVRKVAEPKRRRRAEDWVEGCNQLERAARKERGFAQEKD